MTATADFIQKLGSLKPGDLGRLREHAGLALDESVDGFDLFAGLWWPLRQKNQRAPRREVAWLVAKLYAFCPTHYSEATLATQLGQLSTRSARDVRRWQGRFDQLLTRPLSLIEPSLQWALALIARNGAGLDWVRLTDELSIWERQETRLRWAEEYLQSAKFRSGKEIPC